MMMKEREKKLANMREAICDLKSHQYYTLAMIIVILKISDTSKNRAPLREYLNALVKSGHAEKERNSGGSNKAELVWRRIATVTPDQVYEIFKGEQRAKYHKVQGKKLKKKEALALRTIQENVQQSVQTKKEEARKEDSKPTLSSIEADLSVIQEMIGEVVKDLNRIRTSLS